MLQANRDGSPVTSVDWSIQAQKSITYTGATNAGAVGATTLFTVTGAVLLRLFGRVTASLGISSVSPSASRSPSSSASLSLSPSGSISPSSSTSPSSSSSPSSSVSASISASTSPSNSRSPSASFSPSTSLSPSASVSPSGSISPSASVSKSLSPSSSQSPSASVSPSSSVSSSISASISPSGSVSPSSSASPSPSATNSANLAVGTATNTAAIITTTLAELLRTNRIWVDGTPSTTVEAVASAAQFIVTEDVIETITVGAVQNGSMQYICSWFPLTPNSTLVAA